MKIDTVKTRLTAMNNRLLALGYHSPDCHLTTYQDGFTIWVAAKAGDGIPSVMENVYKRETVDEALTRAENIINNLKSIQEHKEAEFIKALGRLIDQGRDAGIDVNFVNPLEGMMKRLSENVITQNTEVSDEPF